MRQSRESAESVSEIAGGPTRLQTNEPRYDGPGPAKSPRIQVSLPATENRQWIDVHDRATSPSSAETSLSLPRSAVRSRWRSGASSTCDTVSSMNAHCSSVCACADRCRATAVEQHLLVELARGGAMLGAHLVGVDLELRAGRASAPCR